MAEKVTITGIIISVMIGSLVILVYTNFIGNLASNYGYNMTTDESGLNSTLDKMTEVYAKTKDYQSKTRTDDISFGLNAGINLVSIYNIVRQFFDISDIVTTMASDAASYLHLEPWFVDIINGVVIIAIVGIVIAIFMGRQEV